MIALHWHSLIDSFAFKHVVDMTQQGECRVSNASLGENNVPPDHPTYMGQLAMYTYTLTNKPQLIFMERQNRLNSEGHKNKGSQFETIITTAMMGGKCIELLWLHERWSCSSAARTFYIYNA